MRQFGKLCATGALASALLILGELTTPVWANSLPETYSYTIYLRGRDVGRSSTHVTTTADALVLESNVDVHFTKDDSISLECRTVADPESFLIRSFEYEGHRGPTKIHGRVTVQGDSVYGTVTRGGAEREESFVSNFDRNLLLEDYVMDHEVLIALAHDARLEGGGGAAEYGLFFPNALQLTTANLAFASTLEIESDVAAVVCKKLIVQISGSEPFASYYDPKRRMPVYMAFPQTSVEVFLDDFFGDSPVSRYRD